MTKRDFLNAVIATVEDEEIKDYAKERLAKLDEANTKRGSKPSAKTTANVGVRSAIVEYLTENAGEKLTAKAIAEALELSPNQVSSLCVLLVKANEICGGEVKIEKVGKRKAYWVEVGEDDTSDTPAED